MAQSSPCHHQCLGKCARNAAATGSNCANTTYTVGEFRRRDDNYAVGSNGTGSADLVSGEPPIAIQVKIVLCNAGHFASPQYYAQDWREAENPGPQDYVSVEISFKVGPGGALVSDFIKAFSEFGMGVCGLWMCA